MMQATELRVGNIINTPEGIQQIHQIRYASDEYAICFMNLHAGYYLSHCEGVPLTEEILLKCGFECRDMVFIKDGLRFININNKYFRGNFPIKSDVVHLHQLQNIYHALTGKELDVKLNNEENEYTRI